MVSRTRSLEPDISKRDARLDLLRGLCLIVMTINHLPPMGVHRFSYETLGYVSSAEVFVLISGITCGWVYGGVGRVRTKRILQRCGYVAFTYILLTLILSIVLPGGFTSWAFVSSGNPHAATNPAGILLMYVAYLLALPLVLRRFQAGNGWAVFCASFGLWLMGQWGIGPRVSVGYLLAWQLLFVAGAWVGYARRHGVPIPGLSSKMALRVVAVCAIGFFFLRHPIVHHPLLGLGWEITSKGNLGIVRLLNLAVLALLMARIPRSLDEKWAKLALPRALSFLGRHSLQVFAWHALVIGVCHFYAQRWMDTPWSLQALMTGVIISTLFLPAALHRQWQAGSHWRSGAMKAPSMVTSQTLISQGSSHVLLSR